MPVDPRVQQLVQKLDVALQANSLADLAKMFFPHLRAKLRVVQQQVRELRALLHEVDFGHSLRLALEFFGRDADQLRQHIAGIVESQRLVKVTCEDVSSQNVICHITIRFLQKVRCTIKRIDCDYMLAFLIHCEQRRNDL